ncbi:uncharacterized protein Ecym_1420 [Eremothecium cymbalariae DBVPG|uniref:Uncharacterized protein n=1 Tax=Eremothecium cymbalariae (strain CBS 270.75 / DBVPG 7215 / KCTC 17166 / NRRL Y-17582) TaxID=931890 RepID=G8JM77_ERECY|nr:hypothetical protein Ecym_1420 [Eremothecium cymbalariae DBVPG\
MRALIIVAFFLSCYSSAQSVVVSASISCEPIPTGSTLDSKPFSTRTATHSSDESSYVGVTAYFRYTTYIESCKSTIDSSTSTITVW